MSTTKIRISSRGKLIWIAVVWCALCGIRVQAQIDPQAEKGDAVFRNLAVLGITVGHAAIYWGYYINGWPDNQFRHTVIEAEGTGSSSSSTVSYCPFDDASYPPTFLSGNTYWGAGNRSSLIPATWDGSANAMSAARRDAIITDAQQLIGTPYCWYNIWDNSAGLDGTVSCKPRSAYPIYPSYIRCDSVVQWVYERVGFNMGNRYTSILDASPYPIDRMSRFYTAYVDLPSTTLQDNGSTYTITASDNSSTPTKVNIVYPGGTTGFYSSPATITKQIGTTFYQGVDLAGHAESWKQVYYPGSGLPDLTISGSVAVSPTSVSSGGTIQVTWTEKNLGTVASSPAHNTKIFLATSAYGTTYQIGYYGPQNTLGAGATYQYSQSVVVSTSIPAGNYYVTAFVDCDQQVSEGNNEGNNIGSSSPTMLTIQPQQATIVVVASPSNGGTVSGGGTYTVGSSRQISATANSGWTFTGWSDGGAQTHNITVPAGGTTYTADFQQQTATITVVANPSNGGTVSGGGTYTVGLSRQISATANSGWTFTGWSDGGVQTHNVTVPAGGATYTANFQQQTSTITAVANPSNGGTVSGGGTYTVGSSRQISATANSGWTFTGWSDGGAQTHNVTVPAGGATYTANFQQQTATITAVANPSNGGTVSGGGTYTVGSSRQISATANSSWTFTGWSDGGAQTHNVTVPAGGATYTANFVGRPIIINPRRTGTTFTLSVLTQVGFNYTLEYKNSFSDTNWTAVQILGGTGGTITLTDTGASGSRRLYRVHVQ